MDKFHLNGACLLFCPIEYYKLQTATINMCVTADQCRSVGFTVFGDYCKKDCQSQAPPVDGGDSAVNVMRLRLLQTGLLPAVSTVCECTAGMIPDFTSQACVACTATQHVWQHFGKCVPPELVPSGYLTSTGLMFCNPATHLYNMADGRCLLACDQFIGLNTLYGRFCVNETRCIEMGLNPTSMSTGAKICGLQCPESRPFNENGTCVEKCTLPYVDQEAHLCLARCLDNSQPSSGVCGVTVLAVIVKASIEPTNRLVVVLKFLSQSSPAKDAD